MSSNKKEALFYLKWEHVLWVVVVKVSWGHSSQGNTDLTSQVDSTCPLQIPWGHECSGLHCFQQLCTPGNHFPPGVVVTGTMFFQNKSGPTIICSLLDWHLPPTGNNCFYSTFVKPSSHPYKCHWLATMFIRIRHHGRERGNGIDWLLLFLSYSIQCGSESSWSCLPKYLESHLHRYHIGSGRQGKNLTSLGGGLQPVSPLAGKNRCTPSPPAGHVLPHQ